MQDVVVLHRSYTECLAETEKPQRDQLIIELPRRMGFRTKELATFQREYTEFDDGFTLVLDSERHQLFRVPLYWKVGSFNNEIFHFTNSLASVTVGVFLGRNYER